MVCWAEKLTAIWAVLLLLALYLLAGNPEASMTAAVVQLLSVFVVPFWIVMRLVDWMTGGPRRRRGVVTVQFHPPA